MAKVILSLLDLTEVANTGDLWPHAYNYHFSNGDLIYKGIHKRTTTNGEVGHWIMKYKFSNGDLVRKEFWSNKNVTWNNRASLGWNF